MLFELMSFDENDRDLDWLIRSLGFAVELELATLPPYLTALWSINDGYGAAEAAITHVVKEEMLHMVLAGNMLSAIGGPVELTPPNYPGPLPGHVIPGLEVPLTRLTKETLLDVFMAIEFPENGPVTTAPDESVYDTIRELYDAIEPNATIGAFYAGIRNAFLRLEPDLRSDFQLSGTVGGHAFGPTDTPEKVLWAIQTISEQGEGTTTSPFTGPDFGSELSHFYRFGEAYHGRRIIGRGDDSWLYEGDPVPMPVVFPMAEIPAGGYGPHSPFEQKFGVSQQARQLLDSFNTAYREVLADLMAAWAEPVDTADNLGRAIGKMFGLKGPAQQLMTIERPDGVGTYGPDWKVA